mgnify:CR=1 FL=1
MKFLKQFEKFEEENDNDDLFDDLISENPLHDTHDFYMFLGRDKFVENEDGTYKKTLEIENMVKITKETYKYVGMMDIRTRFQTDTKLYHIWLPKELEEEVSGKSSGKIEPYIVELIDKYKQFGADIQGIETYKMAKQRREEYKKFNL